MRFFAREFSLTDGDFDRVASERVLTLAAMPLASSSNPSTKTNTRRVHHPKDFTSTSSLKL
jgi:hypothetical protein